MANTKSEEARAELKADVVAAPVSEKEKTERREIKGGIPYSTSPGVLKRALELIIPAERPDKFTANYMETILKLTGGSARAVPPFFKKMNFIASDGSPTPLYSKFKTDGGRSQAAYDGLRNAFSELFRRNEYVHRSDENAVKDIIVEITGLRKSDPIIRFMYSSFDAVRSFITSDVNSSPDHHKADLETSPIEENEPGPPASHAPFPAVGQMGLSYQINIVLPETDNISVFNAIFKSLRDNLLR